MEKIFLVAVQRPGVAPVNYFADNSIEVAKFATDNPDAQIVIAQIQHLPVKED